MTTARSAEYLVSLVYELCKLPHAWVEFKVNNAAPREIGEYLSALADTAALRMLKLVDEDASRKLMKYVPFRA